ncbi:MAG: type IV pilus secretin PilQ [Oxalobacter sp.]|nr:MAG: type IV pilus secretin PilQ [Oxalobacter sp.]
MSAMLLSRLSKWTCMALCLSVLCGVSRAQENAIQSIEATQKGAGVVVKVTLKAPPATQPIGFAITNPARVAIDFNKTANATGKSLQDINLGDVRTVNIVDTGERSRLVFNLKKTMNFATEVSGNVVTVTIDRSPGLPAAAKVSTSAGDKLPQQVNGDNALRNIDFRRGTIGEGRVVIDLPHSDVAVDVKHKGRSIEVDFMKANLPEALRRIMDVTDFGTPVTKITTKQQGKNIKMLIEAAGVWEYSAYQSDAQLVIEVKPIKEDPNKLAQGNQGYKGEKLSLNFQNIEVRAVLQVIADFTGFNIITSDTVGGNLTLRLKDVPWDQALDIVMRAKGLDMRRNGNVVWIAPRDELLTKEKLELEQKAQIAELEPLRLEIFQLNYFKAMAMSKIFGIKEDGTSDPANKNRILSKRGSVVIDPRTNQIFVTDIPSKLEELRVMIEKTDIPQRQVMIEARIVEAEDSFGRNLGVRLGMFGNRVSRNLAVGSGYSSLPSTTGDTSTVSGTGLNLPAGTVSGFSAASLGLSLFNSSATRYLNLELSALEAENRGKVISSPRVVTADNVKALIEQGTEIPYKEASSSGAVTISFKKAVLKLEVTPQITPDGKVILTVLVHKDKPDKSVFEGSTEIVAIDTKKVQTEVLVENGGTVVIGGIFELTKLETKAQVPLLGDIPFLGWLFKSKEITDNKTELLVFLTPKIMSGVQAK